MTTGVIDSRERAYRSTADAIRDVMRPPSRAPVSDWADENRVLTAKNSPEPGPWRTSRVPYTREIMDTLGDPMVRNVVFMAASQVGKTEIALNFIGRQSDLDPGPIMVVLPTEKLAKRWSLNRLAPMIDNSPPLKEKFAEAGSRKATNTQLHKEFDGGHLILVGANSPADLAGEPIRDALFDEIDRYPASVAKEGDPVSVGEQRTRNFWNRTRYKVSSPVLMATSRIYPEYLASDQRKFFVPCPECGEFQVLMWKVRDASGKVVGGVHWEKGQVDGETVHRPETAGYICEHCHCVLEEHHKFQMLERGEWRATNPAGAYPGFHISAIYSPFVSFVELVELWLEKKDDPTTLQTFINLQLGEPWEERDGDFEPADLEARAEAYPAEVPYGVGLLTASVDVQDDRLELAVYGWGDGEESWLLSHQRIHGDPEQDDVWATLEHELARKWRHESGRDLRIEVAMIDSGFLQKRVFRFVKGKEGRKIYASKGADGRVREDLSRAVRRNRSKVKPWTINTHFFKLIMFRRLKWTANQKDTDGSRGYMHFCKPTKTGADAEFFAQYGAETPELERVGRKMVRVFRQHRARNEAIDLYVMALAALYSLGDSKVKRLGEKAEALVPVEEDDDPPEEKPRKPKARKKSAWAGRWKR